MVIKHNLSAMNANRQYGLVTGSLAKSTEKLSSGYQVNRAADDATGLAISEKMRRQIRGLTQASANCQDGISLVQIADGALNEVHDMLQRLTELSIKSATDTLNAEDRGYIQSEVSNIIAEIDKIAERTTFNNMPVLQGKRDGNSYAGSGSAVIQSGLPGMITDASPDLQAGHLTTTYTDGTKTYAAGVVDLSMINSSNIDQLDGQGFTMTCATCDNHYSVEFTSDTNPDPAKRISGQHYIYKVSTDGVTNGTELVDRIYSALDNGRPNSHYTHLVKDNDKLIIYDDRGQDNVSGDMSRLNTYQQRSTLEPGIAISADELPENEGIPDIRIQCGAESGQCIEIKLPAINSTLLGINNTDVRTQEAASKAITDFKNALSYVSGERSRMGAYQNRLEHTIKNLDNVVENTTAAESQIRDTDMAREMVQFSLKNILAQAGQTMITQTNQSSQGVLSLLQ